MFLDSTYGIYLAQLVLGQNYLMTYGLNSLEAKRQDTAGLIGCWSTLRAKILIGDVVFVTQWPPDTPSAS